jgi:hypothetical protein
MQTAALHFDSLCPSKHPMLALHVDVFEEPHPLRELQVFVDAHDLSSLQRALSCGLSPASLRFSVTRCPQDACLVTVLFFAEIYYADLKYLEPGEQVERHGEETVYLGQATTVCDNSTGMQHVWDFPMLHHGRWLSDGVSKGDAVALRAVACEAGAPAARDASVHMCSLEGAMGCNIFPVIELDQQQRKMCQQPRPN